MSDPHKRFPGLGSDKPVKRIQVSEDEMREIKALLDDPSTDFRIPREHHLYDADPDCEHDIVDGDNYSGIKCSKCSGWFCL